MGMGTRLAAIATAIVLASSCTSGTEPQAGPVAAVPGVSSFALLMPAGAGDGDSWHDTAGVEYRLGLVNTPEYNECFGSEGTAKRKELTAHGFRADVYAQDAYGRGVSLVTTADGVNVNVYLARYGYANDRYLSQYRHENPQLASQLDTAFAKARKEHLGLWSACQGTQGAPAPPAPTCATGVDVRNLGLPSRLPHVHRGGGRRIRVRRRERPRLRQHRRCRQTAAQRS